MNKIPPLQAREFLREYTPPADQPIVTIRDSVVGTLCNYVVFSGLPKVGKSTYVSGLIASAFMPQGVPVFSQKISPPVGRPRVALFDTESAPYDLHRTRERIRTLASRTYIPDTLDIYTLREDPPHINRAFIEQYLHARPDCACVVVDGLLDLCMDYNDVTETRAVTNWLKRITKTYNCCAVLVLHLSKNTGETLGHLGANTDRWAQSTVTVRKNKEAAQLVMEPKFLRSAQDFEPVAIVWDEYAQRWRDDHYIIPQEPPKRGPGRPKKN